MALIRVEQPWYEQPNEAVHIASAWSGRVKYAAVGGFGVDIAGQKFETSSYAFQQAVTVSGGAVDPTTTGTRYIEATPPNTADFAVVSVIVPQSVSGLQQIAARDDPAVRRVFQFRTNTTGVEFIRFNTAPAAFTASVTAVASVGVPLVCVASTVGANVRLWAGDKAGTATITGTPQSWITESAGSSRWFERLAWSTGNEHGSHYSLLRVIIAGGVTDVEGADLARNPWQLFEPRRIWVPQAAASGLPTLGTVSASAITSSGFRPSVTYTY